MARTKTKPQTTIEERTHFVGIYTPRNSEPRIEILREEIDGDKSTNLGVKKSLTYAQMQQTAAFATFKQTLGIADGTILFVAMRDLFDDLCEE